MTEPNLQSGGRKGMPTIGCDFKPTPLVSDGDPKHGSRKDTKRWCGGRKGIEHDPVWQYGHGAWGRDQPMEWQYKRCLICGRYLGLRQIRSDIPPSRQ